MADDMTPKQPASSASGADYPMMVPLEAEASSVSPLQVQRFFVFLKKYWWVPVLTVILSVGAAITYIVWAPPTYVSVARMWETEKLRLPEGAAFTGDLQNYYGTQIELLRSIKIQQLALARLQAARTNSIPLGEDNKPLKVKLQVAQMPKSTVFAIEASCASPEYAQTFLNALTVEYLEYKRNIRKLVSGDTLASISDQVLRLEKELKGYQDALTSFQRTNNLAILQEEGAIAGGYLARLKTQLSDLKLEAQLLEATSLEQEWAAASKTNTSDFLVDSLGRPYSTSPIATAERQSAFKEVELLKIQREKLSRYLRPKHPKIVKLDSDIERAQKLMAVYRSQSRDQLGGARQALKMKIDSVQGSIQDWEVKAVEANGRIAQAEHLKLNITRAQSLYDRLVMMLQNVDISRNIDQETLSILDQASPAERSYKLEAILLAVSFLASMGLSFGMVLLIAVRDDRFTSTAEVTEKLPGSIVGQVPEVHLGGAEDALPLLEPQDKRHMYAESYRNLRSALLFQPVEGPRPKVVLVTSALPEEGKSTITANLARTLAFGGARVLLVDADLRKGVLHEMLGVAAEPGLSELLRRPGVQDLPTRLDSLQNLSFIPRGASQSNPGDLFLSQKMEAFLARWRKDFDYVLIDSSPVFATDDAPTLAPKTDGTLFIVRSGYSPAGAVRQALDLLAQRQARILGLVYNRADGSSARNYFYKYPKYYQPGIAA